MKIAAAILLCVLSASASKSAMHKEVDKITPARTNRYADTDAGEMVNGMQIKISTDKKAYSRNDEIHVTVEYVNHRKKEFRILENVVFIGSNFVFKAEKGRTIPLEGGYTTFSYKTNHWPGRTVLIKPGEHYKQHRDVLVDYRYNLVFSGPALGKNFSAIRKHYNLPDDYPERFIGCGRIFSLKNPGRYQMIVRYETTPNDTNWIMPADRPKHERSTQDLWTGTIQSNMAWIEIK